MLCFSLVYSPDYYLPIGEHVFPAQKYQLIYQRLIGQRLAQAEDFVVPQPASDEDILLAHTPEYVHKLKTGTLSGQDELLLEIPFSPQLVKAFWLCAGGSILAAQLALRDGIGFNLGGGFHHAFPDHGEGFCMINDVAIAIRRLLHDKKIARAMTVDCDVHQGNGTAAMFSQTLALAETQAAWSAPLLTRSRPVSVREAPSGNVFTISLHQENNYPAWKPPSSIDVNLPDRTSDADYLAWLDNALSAGLRQFQPDLICYLAGADPFKEDQLGGLSLTIGGLRQRDELVFHTAHSRGIPVMVTYAGGYAHNLDDTVAIHCNTVRAATGIYDPHPPPPPPQEEEDLDVWTEIT